MAKAGTSLVVPALIIGRECPLLGKGEEGSGPRVLLKSGPGNRGRSAFGPTHVARLEFPRETGLILRSHPGDHSPGDHILGTTALGTTPWHFPMFSSVQSLSCV